LHAAVALSHYSELMHVEVSVELAPSAAQCRTVKPEQKYVVAQQASHVPL
jgi:hypothetical protein